MKIGIDLGTTNSALAFINPAEAEGSSFPPVHILEIPQQVTSSATESRRTLPSFLFLEGDNPVGEYAREQGALVPTKSVHSAKSWLSNPEVDRRASILPWDAQQEGRVMSPVEASARYLAHLRSALAASGVPASAPHDVVLTVPASFDEEARELTVEAAATAGFEKVTLLEEPAAAFYAWIANHLSQSQKNLRDGMTVLVCDVGGGTSDFTLIRVNREADRVAFTRTAVGKHLLLGGDNLDLTLGWLVESKLQAKLTLRQRSALRRQCSAAKEQLLHPAGPPSAEITVLGGGSSLVGGTLKAPILREEALELALEGFLPFCALDEKPAEESRSIFRELGLPYVSDPAITRHLAAFLRSSNSPAPDAVLFNGGFFIPEILRTRVADVIGHWYGARPQIFENNDLDLAVAAGAAYYSFVKTGGEGILVRGGLPRTYFIGIGGAGPAESLRTVCLVPRGAEEGSTLTLDIDNLELIANKAVSFRLYSSLHRDGDTVGDIVEFDPSTAADDLHRHAPLESVIRFGRKAEERNVPVLLSAKLTEVGTLEIWAESKVSEHKWRLQFELRKPVLAEQARRSKPAAVLSSEAVDTAESLIRSVFTAASLAPEDLPSKLEETLALGRNSWPLEAIRRLADTFLECSEGRRQSPAHEIRWLNLGGLCLRPGFGFPGDDYRIELARRVFAQGLTFASRVECESQWWIFWGRVAGGLNRNQQADLFQRLAPTLLPRGKAPRTNSSLLREMWRCAASLELLPAGTRTELGNALVKRIRNNDASASEFWCLARLGARKLFYAPVNQVLPSSVAVRWIESIARIEGSMESIARIGQVTGDAARDLPPATQDLIRRTLSSDPSLLFLFESGSQSDLESMGRVFGEQLPSGLVLSSD